MLRPPADAAPVGAIRPVSGRPPLARARVGTGTPARLRAGSSTTSWSHWSSESVGSRSARGRSRSSNGTAEGPTDHGGGRDQLARTGAEPIESCLERALERCRNGGLTDQDDVTVLPLQRSALAGDRGSPRRRSTGLPPVRAGNEVRRARPTDHRRRPQRRLAGVGLRRAAVARARRKERLNRRLARSTSCQAGVIGVAAVDDQEAGSNSARTAGSELIEQRERCFVRPVKILEDQAERVLPSERADELVKPVERLLPDTVASGDRGVGCFSFGWSARPSSGGEEGISRLGLGAEGAARARPGARRRARASGSETPRPSQAREEAREPASRGSSRCRPRRARRGIERVRRSASAAAATSRDLPIPGSPVMETIAPLPSMRPSRASLSAASSILASNERRVRCGQGLSGGSPRRGRLRPVSLFPFSSRSPSDSSSNSARARRAVAGPMTRSPSVCRRAATLTVSPRAL